MLRTTSSYALREKLGAIDLRRIFSADRRRRNVPCKRRSENYLDRCRQGAPTSVPNLQARAGSRARRGVRAGASSLASTHYDRALPAMSLRNRCGNF